VDPVVDPLADRLDALTARFFAEARLPVYIDEDNPADRSALVATGDALAFVLKDGDGSGEPVVFLRNSAGAIAGVNVGGVPLRRLAYVELP
jgi:hypothetical protein